MPSKNDKLRLLQHFLREASSGKRSILPNYVVELVWGMTIKVAAKDLRKITHVWFDLFSVPQRAPRRPRSAAGSSHASRSLWPT